MQTPRSINDPSTGLVSLVAILLSVLLLLVSPVHCSRYRLGGHHPGKGGGGSRLPADQPLCKRYLALMYAHR